jgi:hypothetical protein
VRWLLLWATVAVSCAAWTAFYVGREDPAYLSDFRHYWKLYWTFGETFFFNPRSWLSQVATSVHTSEYNALFTVALLPFNWAWGRARIGYIEGLVLLYMLPAMLVAWFVIRRWCRATEAKLSTEVENAVLATVVLTTSFWIPTLRGYPDVWGLVPLGLAIWWLRSAELARRQHWTTLAGLALCIYAPFLIRKWYVFSIIAVLLAHGIVSGWQLHRSRATVHSWRRWILNHAIIGALVLACVFTLQGQMAVKALTYTYADAYVAFQRSSLEHVQDLVARHGLLLPLLCLSGWWLSVRRQSPAATTFAYLWLALVFTVALFTRVQGLDTHHHLPVGLFLCLMAALSIALWAEALDGQRTTRAAFLVVACALMLFNFVNVFVPAVQVSTISLLQERRFGPLRLENPGAYRQVADFIEQRVAQNQRVSIVGSNAVFSQTMIENFLSDSGIRKIAPIAEVDEYEGFNLRPLYSDYLVVPSRPQIVRAEHQRIVSVLSDMVVQGRTIGAAYTEVERIAVTPDLEFLVFRKSRGFTAEELRAFLDNFSQLHRPPGLSYTPMELALAGVQTRVQSAGAWPHRIDMVGGGEWAVQLPPGTKLDLAFGFWPDWLPQPPSSAVEPARKKADQVIFSTQLPPERVAHCRTSPPHMQVTLDGRMLLAKEFNSPLVEFFPVAPADIPRLQLHLVGGADAGCDLILIDHRTD